MMHFFHQFLLYTTFEVLEPLWHTLQAHIRASTTLDQARASSLKSLRRFLLKFLRKFLLKFLLRMLVLLSTSGSMAEHVPVFET